MRVMKYLFSGLTIAFRTILSSNVLPLLCGQMDKVANTLIFYSPYHDMFDNHLFTYKYECHLKSVLQYEAAICLQN